MAWVESRRHVENAKKSWRPHPSPTLEAEEPARGRGGETRDVGPGGGVRGKPRARGGLGGRPKSPLQALCLLRRWIGKQGQFVTAGGGLAVRAGFSRRRQPPDQRNKLPVLNQRSLGDSIKQAGSAGLFQQSPPTPACAEQGGYGWSFSALPAATQLAWAIVEERRALLFFFSSARPPGGLGDLPC